MRTVTAPTSFVCHDDEQLLFLAGGITGCPPWQTQMLEMLGQVPKLVILNPRRNSYDAPDKASRQALAQQQIAWEWRALWECSNPPNAISFWFCKETVQPITLFELGRHTALIEQRAIVKPNGALSISETSTVFVGVHPEYERKLDIEVQLHFQCPHIEIVDSLELLAKQILAWATGGQV